ncbi:MAG: hypothetical protein HUU54_02580 [Ignavibacteriaceae bacterium]|nr:hypothetical protein [Ignavibacteriaceae bacterium]
MSTFTVALKRIESSTDNSGDGFTVYSVKISASAFEYRKNSGGIYPPGFFFFITEEGVKQDLPCFFPADTVLAIWSDDLVPT